MTREQEDFMLTTFDNQFNPFDEFNIWWKEDLRLGHDCCGLLARTSNTNELQSDEMQEKEIRRAAEEIVKNFPFIYKIVYRSDYPKSGKEAREGV